jgi:hypothetical protein
MGKKNDKDAELARKREEAQAKWEKAQKDIERHDREFREKHGDK